MNTDIENLFKDKVIGHPAGLFVIFFTEMWERFSFYGMKILLVLFLTAPYLSDNPGWEWSRENALALIGTYSSLLYLTPIVGGWLADKITGYKWAVIIGCFIMMLGHAAMVFETTWSLYLGLALLVIGTGFFKPNMTSMISEMYKGKESKKDGAYTIYYMGVNAGAFFGMMLCGYLAENIGWSYGFGLAGIFMLGGLVQFWLAKDLFGQIGERPSKVYEVELPQNINEESPSVSIEKQEDEKLNPFTSIDKLLIVLSAIGGLLYLFNDPISKIGNINLLPFSLGNLDGSSATILIALVLFLYLIISRMSRYNAVIRDKIIAVSIFGIFTVFFFGAFEQSLGSMTLFARDYTARALTGNSALIFKIIDTVLTIVPLAIITWVLYLLFKKTYSKIPYSNIVLGATFVFLWYVVYYKINNEFSKETTEVGASWFGILNSFFIITLAPLFSKWWESKYNPSVAMKYGIGLILLGLGFGILVFGTLGIPQGAKTASVSMIFLILAYLFHTMGELCISPVGLSYLSKLVPGRMIGFMFGIWYLAIAIGQKAAGTMGGMIDKITEQYSLSTFFLIFTLVPAGVGVISMLLNPILKKLMHGVR
ncbi:peptide MFS transporter [Algibacter luteus]|uniref:Proton-dependent oligopeptide transporter, POT family n=1 Tax=Algibacter luteus TaxID=1178825 RepID=A0A1M6G4X7_9FLAO|nr:peptide MFS transporter [Algibacter luteus]WJJ96259.1 peptide MFS transporter [Algibacter luteus]SHJ05031.1 proton-dependent oligopeptide transporter, POT family [Algibacter luteus]